MLQSCPTTLPLRRLGTWAGFTSMTGDGDLYPATGPMRLITFVNLIKSARFTSPTLVEKQCSLGIPSGLCKQAHRAPRHPGLIFAVPTALTPIQSLPPHVSTGWLG